MPRRIIVRSGGTCEYHTSFFIHRHSTPAIGAVSGFPCIRGPGLVPQLTGMGYSMEYPSSLPRVNIVGHDVARRGFALYSCTHFRFSCTVVRRTKNNYVLVDNCVRAIVRL